MMTLTALDTTLDLLARGYWPIPITAADDPGTPSPGKAPIGREWGRVKHTTESIWEAFDRYKPLQAGVGLKLGPESGLIDIDIDDPEAAAPALSRIFGEAGPPATMSWTSPRGRHWAFRWDDRIKKYGKAIVKGHPSYPGIEIRFGWSTDGKQYQSVCPPSIGTDGRAREWVGTADAAELPDAFFADLDRHLLAVPTPGVRPFAVSGSLHIWTAEERACAYLTKCEPAISGKRGHDKAFKAACKVGPGFGLDPEVTLRIMRDVYNPTCQPPWSESELRHKVDEAFKVETRRGWMLGDVRKVNGHTRYADAGGADVCVSELPDDPHRLANAYMSVQRHDGHPTLLYWLEEWYRWDGRCWHVETVAEVRADLVKFIKADLDTIALTMGRDVWKITTGMVANVMQALSSVAMLTSRDCPRQPAWLADDVKGLPDPDEILQVSNGLMSMSAIANGKDGFMELTPQYFSSYVLNTVFDPRSPRPVRWLSFLDSLWPDDPESIGALQEWFGYLLTPDTSQQKLLMIVGPPRSGKGTIGRVIGSLVGEKGLASPTLSSLASNFGVAPLIGKTVAIFPDARLSGRLDSQVIVERLLSISGEDMQTIDRKHLSSWTGRLTTRFVVLSNELPRLGDSSGAINARTIVLRLTRSFIGEEDTTLYRDLRAELPSLLLWSIAGWARLKHRGHFLQPASGRELLDEMRELSSPISLFIEERCVIGAFHDVRVKDLYSTWREWCQERGRDHPGDEQGFGRSLRAALPHLEMRRVSQGGTRVREYIGIGLSPSYA